MSNPFEDTLTQASAPTPGGSVRSDSAAKQKARRYMNVEPDEDADEDGPCGHVSVAHELAFNWLRSADEHFGLISCFVNDKPSALIVAARRRGEKRVEIIPLFVALCDGMKITDHDGDVIWSGGVQ